MAEFLAALPYTLNHEGGFSNDPDDPGGATNKGITLAVAQRHGIGTVDDLRAITDEKVAEIYRADYWKFDVINSQRVATKLFDMAVNMGPKTAIRLAQRGLNDLHAGLKEDGVMGPKTSECINVTDSEHMLTILCDESKRHYLDIVVSRPKSMKYLGGWLRRAMAVPGA